MSLTARLILHLSAAAIMALAFTGGGNPALARLISDGSLGPLVLGPADTLSFNTDTGAYSINGGPPIPGGVSDPDSPMVYDFTTITLYNTTPITAVGKRPLALAATGPVVIGGGFNLTGQFGPTPGNPGGGGAGPGAQARGCGGVGGSAGSNGCFGGPGGNGACAPVGANGGGGGGGGGGYARIPGNGIGGNGAITAGGGGGGGGCAGGNGGAGNGLVNGGAGGAGAGGGGSGGMGSLNGGNVVGNNGLPGANCLSGGGGGGGGGGALGNQNAGPGGNGGVAGGGGGGGGATVAPGRVAGKGGKGAGGCGLICVQLCCANPRCFPTFGGGGAGGGGGKGSLFGAPAPRGGHGGGAIDIESLHSITFVSGGGIDARGGNAETIIQTGDGAGGGGGGGTIMLGAPVIDGALPGMNLQVAGGYGSTGESGNPGTIVIQPLPDIDCDDNGVADDEEIASGASLDCNENGLPDQCEHPGCAGILLGDQNCSATVDGLDISPFIQRVVSGQYLCQADLNQDGLVNLSDAPYMAQLLLCGPDCAPNRPQVSSDRVCYQAGETAVVRVGVLPLYQGSLLFEVYRETGDDPQLISQEVRSLNGSSLYVFSVPLPTAGMYGAVARLLNPGGLDVAADALSLGARPNLPNISADLCTFENFPLDAAALRSQVEAAVAMQTAMLLQIGSRSFTVMLWSYNDMLAPEVLAQNPSLATYRGAIAGAPSNSDVRLTFGDGFVHGFVEWFGPDGGTVYLEPSVVHDAGLPPDLYLGYLAQDVRVPMDEHGASGATLVGPGPDESADRIGPAPIADPPWRAAESVETVRGDAQSPVRGGFCPLIIVRVYYDGAPNLVRLTQILSSIETSFFADLGASVQFNYSAAKNTDAYRDPPSLIDDFKADIDNDVPALPANVDVAMLWTRNNANISYGSTLGQGYWCPARYAGNAWRFCWVYRGGSDHQMRIVGLQEISHVLGASNRPCTTLVACSNTYACPHRDTVRRSHCHATLPGGACAWSHDHYSIMKAKYAGDEASDANWLAADIATLNNTIATTAGHFCNP